ncbi:MAG: type II toxin-antitoxin system HicB family antitoxin [Oscillospiraceae bacterium]|nr:type II toxin-antitoxin system HicB family antitoxin [Oscillospiraceae bacterium]
MNYIYPAIFSSNDDGSYTITYPDLKGCISEGKDLENAMVMAQSALSQWLEYLDSDKQEFPKPSEIIEITVEGNEFTSLIRADIRDSRAVKRTVSLPKWMDEKVSEMGLSLSRVLQDALAKKMS